MVLFIKFSLAYIRFMKPYVICILCLPHSQLQHWI